MTATRGEAGPRGGRHGGAARTRLTWLATFVVLVALATLGPPPAEAHPLGNFSISHYAAIRVEKDVVELRYLVDMAEIPTFQEIQEAGITPEAGHPGLSGYLARKIESLKEGLLLEVNGRRLRLEGVSSEVIFPPGAGGLPTMKVGTVYRASLGGLVPDSLNDLRYGDTNFAARAGWKEVVAVEGRGIAFASSSVPAKDRSRELADYPTDLLNSPPQDLEARVIFAWERSSEVLAAVRSPDHPAPGTDPKGVRNQSRPPASPSVDPVSIALPKGPQGLSERILEGRESGAHAATAGEPVRLQANRLATPRNAFTELIGTSRLGLGIVLVSLVVAAGLGAFHALEPGHGKTVVAAYLVGSRGTAWHALLLGLIVTGSHTAGVYLLGGVTLYASRYVVPERLYPWLGVVSGLTIAGLGILLFLRRYAGEAHPHSPAHHHHHDHHHHPHSHDHGSTQDAAHVHGVHGHHAHHAAEAVSPRELLALGVTGGIIPCPAALVVLLSALSLNRVGFGLLLIVAFSVGLAAVLIAIGLLMVYARRFMSRFHGEGRLITRWLPLSSAAVITFLGVALAVQALSTSALLGVRL